jgi:hypothetical protein
MIPAIRRAHFVHTVMLLALATPLRAQNSAPSDALAKLVPEGTAVYVQAPSLDRLGAAVKKIVGAFDKEKAQSFDLDAMIREGGLPVSPANIDHGKPLAFCLVLPATQGGEPSPAVLLPSSNPDALVKEVSGGGMPFKTSVDGGYVTLTMAPDAKKSAGPAAIATGLPAGEISARVDVKRLVAHFRPMIDMGLAQMQMAMASMPPEATNGMDVGPMLKLYADGMRSVVDSGETLDLALRLDGNRCEIASNLTAQEKSALAEYGSKEKTDAKALARYADSSSPVGVVFGADPGSLAKKLRPLIDAVFTAYPEPLRSQFKKAMASFDDLSAAMGSGVSGGGTISADGMRYALYLRPKDPKKLVEIYRTMLKAMPTATLSDPKEETVDGIPVTRMRLKIDPQAMADALAKQKPAGKQSEKDASEPIVKMLERMYGKDGLQWCVGTKGDTTAVVIGGDDAYLKSSLARLSTPGQVPAGIARGLEQVGDLSPCMVLHYDIGKMMHDMQGMMGDAFPNDKVKFPDTPASVTSWIGVDGRTFRGAMSVDLAELAAFAQAMKNTQNANAPATPKK